MASTLADTRHAGIAVTVVSFLTKLYLVLLTLTLQLHLSAPQAVEIRKTIKEEQLPGYIIADLSSDPEFLAASPPMATESAGRNSTTGSSLRYSVITSGNPQSQYFAVDSISGVVTVRRSIDRERICSFKDECVLTFQIAARAVLGGFFRLITFIISVTDINDNPPEFTQRQFEVNIPENAEVGRSFQLPTAFDRDAGLSNRVQEYRILEGPPQFGLRMVQAGANSTDVYLSLNEAVSREAAVAYKVLVGAIDGGIPPLTGTLTLDVQITDINDNLPIFDQPVYEVSIPEVTGQDQVLVQVKATDADSGLNGEVVYSFSAQQPPDDLDYFRVDPQSGEIFLTGSVESRAGEEIELLVEASDRGHPPKLSKTVVKIHIEDTINSLPEIIIDTLGGSQEGIAEVSEYADIGKVVGFISVRDPDSGDNGRTSCRLNSPEFQLVQLDDDGKYKAELMARLDREKQDNYDIVLTCSDSGFPSLTATATFSVKVMDENDHEPVFTLANYEVTMYENNTLDMFVTQVTATDEDIGVNAEITYGITGNHRSYFHVDTSGRVVAKVLLDRELSEQIMVTVTATDKGSPPLSSSAVLTVNLLDVNDVRPTFLKPSYTFDLEEEQFVGSFVGVLSAVDADTGVNREITYMLQDSPASGSDSFIISAGEGIIRTNAILDREQREVYNLVVLAVDKGAPPLTGSATVIIKLIDLNDNDPFFLFPSLDNNTIVIPHSVDPGEKIVLVQAMDTDKDLNAKIIYSLSSVNSSSPFVIEPMSGVIFVKERLRRGQTGVYILTIMANDQGPKQQRATQIPFYIEVYFDNSTMVSVVETAELPLTLIGVFAGAGVVLLVILTILIVLLCIKRRRSKTKFSGVVPNSASTSSTTKLQGGYYIAPGVQGSRTSFPGKPQDVTDNSITVRSNTHGVETNKPYIVVLPHTDTETSAEIVEIAINGFQNGYNDSLDLNQIDDDRFSTFRSQENILAPSLRYGSLRRQEQQERKKAADENCDNLSSCDDSTSDSGRGGSDVDVAAAAAKQAAAAAPPVKATTPIAVNSGLPPRLSPLPQKDKTLITFRGESPNLFTFDSNSDSLPRGSYTVRASSVPIQADPRRFGSGSASAFSTPVGEIDRKKSTGEDRQNSRHFVPLQPADETSVGQAPGHLLSQNSTYPRHDNSTATRDGGLKPTYSLTRRNPLPKIPQPSSSELIPHRTYGVIHKQNPSNSDIRNPDVQSAPEASTNYKQEPGRHSNKLDSVPHNSANVGGTVRSGLVNSHADSVEEDFLLPPYPEVEEDDDMLTIHSGYTDYDAQTQAERSTLFSKSRFESSA